MKSKLTVACLVLASLCVSVAATAQDSDRTHPLTFVKDSVITTKIKAKLGDEKLSTLVHVHVDTDAHGIVELTGTVKSADLGDRAVLIAKGTEGVTEVRNHITIKND